MVGRLHLPRSQPSHLLLWFEVDLLCEIKASYRHRGTIQNYTITGDSLRLRPSEIYDGSGLREGLIIVIIGVPWHNCNHIKDSHFATLYFVVFFARGVKTMDECGKTMDECSGTRGLKVDTRLI